MIGIVYLLSIVAVNAIFVYTGPNFGAICVGVIFVLRDYVQQRFGHGVLLWMLAGCGLSFFLASPVIATASLTAFLFAEGSDWLVFTALPFDFRHRVLFSSVIGVAIDSLIFIPMALGVIDLKLAAIMWMSKMLAAVAVWSYYTVKV